MFRGLEPSESIEFEAFEGECRYCRTEDGFPGIVKIHRSMEDFTLQPDRCMCLLCGQHYYIETEDIWGWEIQQSLQKATYENLRFGRTE